MTLFRDARTSGGLRAWNAVVQEPPTDGLTLRLTLDASLQHVTERELAAGATKARARSGSVVVLDPRSGAIMSLASWPPFDPETDPRNPATGS